MQRTKLKKHIVLPIVLLIYLLVMSIIGFDEFRAGNYLYYFGIIGITLLVIFLLYFNLKKKDKLRQEREDDIKRNKK